MKNMIKLEAIVAQLRGENGCPWDKEQTHQSIKICLLEEVAEVLEAIDNNDDESLLEELGDLLLQVVFHAQIAKEQNRFNFENIAERISQKLISRHPHVFSEKICKDSVEVLAQWEKLKQQEKSTTRKRIFDGIPTHLTALHKMEKILQKAKKSNAENLLPKFEEKDFSELSSPEDFAQQIFILTQIASTRNLHLEDELRKFNNELIKKLNQ